MNAWTSILYAAAVSAAAWRARALDPGGAAAATVVGALVLAGGGWPWALTLVAFFVSAAALSAWGGATKRRRLAAAGAGVERHGRDARQVLANGGWAAFAAWGATSAPGPGWAAVFFGSLAAAAADTWATELGVLAGGRPRHLRTGRRVPPGTSGAVSLVGTAAAAGGAAFVAATGLALGALDPGAAAAVALAGVLGAAVDSVLGATVQARFRCPVCGANSEVAAHPGCGARGRRVAGWPAVGNNLVNWFGTSAGAGLALALT
jgi:uncharacterized protein (TIGR00297 family)